MSGGRFRAWRFEHPDFATSEPGLSISTGGGIAMIDEPESIRQAILILLTTLPGERVMRPAYGCDLFKLVFSPNDSTTAGLAIHYVRRAVTRWEPRVEIVYLDATRKREDADWLDISLEYRIRTVQRTDRIALAMNLAKGSL
ncbi:MAG: GPW/gp25 family protein [Stellaceae bacterium]